MGLHAQILCRNCGRSNSACHYSLLSDRRHSKEFSMQYEESCKRLEEYVSCLEKEIRDRSGLTVLLEQSELYYDAQFGEARIVANVS